MWSNIWSFHSDCVAVLLHRSESRAAVTGVTNYHVWNVIHRFSYCWPICVGFICWVTRFIGTLGRFWTQQMSHFHSISRQSLQTCSRPAVEQQAAICVASSRTFVTLLAVSDGGSKSPHRKPLGSFVRFVSAADSCNFKIHKIIQNLQSLSKILVSTATWNARFLSQEN